MAGLRDRCYPCPTAAGEAGYCIHIVDVPDGAFAASPRGFWHVESIEPKAWDPKKTPAHWGLTKDWIAANAATSGGITAGYKRDKSNRLVWVKATILEPFLEPEFNEWGEVAP